MREFWAIVELRTKLVSLTSLGLGLIVLLKGSHQPVCWTAVVLFAVVLFLLDMGTTAFNTFFDFWHGVDRRDLNFEADKVLIHQGTAPGTALVIALLLYALAGVLGLALVYLRGSVMAIAGILGMLVGFSYSGGPRPLSGTPWGELFAGTFLGGLVIILVYFAGTGTFSLEVVNLSLPSTAMVAALLAVNHACDRQPDQLAGRRTLAVVLGPLAAGVPLILGLVAWGLSLGLLWRNFNPLSITFFLIGILMAAYGVLRMKRRGFSARSKGPQMRAMLSQLALFSVNYALLLLLQAPASY